MAKPRVKKRTHIDSNGRAPAPGNVPKKAGDRSPKSMVIRTGGSEVGPSMTQLVRDVRSMMEPDTATRLRERRSNKLRDYTTMAGPLGVTHLLLFSRSSNGNTNLRIALTPRGPTLHFRIEKYSLCKDIHQSQKRPKSGGNEYLSAPLLVMNNFSSSQVRESSNPGQQNAVPKHLESLTTTIFQSLFPPINPTTTPLKGIKRILLLDRSSQDSYILNLRHYAIETRTAKSVPKPLRRLDAAEKLAHTGQKRKRGGLPNLGKLDDVADYILDPQATDGFTSASESEPDTDAEVQVLAPSTRKVKSRKQVSNENGNGNVDNRPNVEKKGIKLHELGPRMRLRLTKVEEGLCTGKVMWHEYITRSEGEIREQDRTFEERRREREKRKAEQKENVARKRKERGGAEGDDEDIEDAEDDDDDVWDDDDGGVELGSGMESDEEIQDLDEEDEG